MIEDKKIIKRNIVKKYILSVICLLIIFIDTAITTNVYAANNTKYCIEITPKATNAAYEYLNEIYIKKYPGLGTEFSFGTDADKEVLKKLANLITNGIKTDKEKAKAIANWISNNVKYCSYTEDQTSYFAIDVFYTRKANCLGYANTLSQLCRLCGIPAVMCGGTRGNMEEYVTLDSRIQDHGWTMIYYDNDWHLYDMLFNEIDKTNRQYISKWYFFEDIEGITPYVKGYEKYFHNGYNTFYINNRFIYYFNDKPFSEYIDSAADGGLSYNNSIPYFTNNRYFNKDNANDGYEYIDDSKRKDEMVNNEAYTNGWIGYCLNKPQYYARENGTLAQCTLKEYKGQLYYLPYGQDSLIIPGKSSDYTLTNGLITLKTGNSINLQPTWIQSQISDFGRIICWKSETPETVKVNKNGTITALKEGYACVQVCSKDNDENDTWYLNTYIELIITTKDRIANYNINTSTNNTKISLKEKCDINVTKAKKYTGKKLTPKVTVKYNNKILKKDVDYTLKYQNNKNVGTASVIITGKGNYTGTVTKTFKINPKGTSLKKLTKGKKQFKATWNKQTTQTTGYQIQYSTSSSFSNGNKTVKVKKNKTTSSTVKKLKAKKKYYVRIRTYKTVNGKTYYSGWSKAKNVTTKK